ncbi:spore maturation protein A [Hathewaya proteolytica DSM 3090]|uniref:Spore maturation protein A n=1 Tax=Hathewaya proteolytica DSM 3090 TaxID=1121331 RepID=A0A1M6PI41_9CLOT|nr:nucleoside recognition domain-containing protein [Hathewaya proteolytica]SHK07592.1 spore maturation protein A [Hathewaya proteolytica DSM 3090]
MINLIWCILVVLGIVIGILTGRGDVITNVVMSSAKSTVVLVFELVGIMCLWCGLIRILTESGAMKFISKLLQPVLKLLFKKEGRSEKAMEAMVMNLTANSMGISNAATPAGIKAMEEMQKLNEDKDSASNDMILFLVLNATCIQFIPSTIISVRAACNSSNPAIIMLPAILSTALAAISGVFFCKILEKRF